MQTNPEGAARLFNEIAPLKELMVWGEPGCEALLGQLLPRSRSLFFSYYEVPEARREFKRMQALIEKEGVRVIRAKDAFAHLAQNKSYPNLPTKLNELERLLIQKADEYFEAHKQEKVQELAQGKVDSNIEDIFLQVKSDIKKTLWEDAETYGEQAAIGLNYLLSLSQPLPMANIFYGRDQSSALGNKIVLSEMRWDIRKPEIGIYKEALIELGYGDVLVEAEEGTVEGGDVVIFGDTCYIGVGARTSLSAVKNIYAKVGSMLEENGIQLLAIVNEKHEKESANEISPTEEEMRIMHLDMFWIPLEKDLVMAYGEEVDHRRAVRVTRKNGEIVTEDLGSFRDYLVGRGFEIIEITTQEQKNFATNLLNLGNHKVIVSLSKNKRVTAELEKRGYQVLQAELNKLVNGYGAVHCLTAPVKRD